MLTAVKAHYQDPAKPYPSEENPVLYELATYLDTVGLGYPLDKIYVTTKYACSAVPRLSLSCGLPVRLFQAHTELCEILLRHDDRAAAEDDVQQIVM